jgi:hypothetical protein
MQIRNNSGELIGEINTADRVALLGRGIAVVQQADHQVALVVLGNGVFGPDCPQKHRPE